MTNKHSPKTLTYKQVLNKIIEIFNYDKDKAISWYMSPQEKFDNLTPYQMVKIGKSRKLMRFLESILT